MKSIHGMTSIMNRESSSTNSNITSRTDRLFPYLSFIWTGRVYPTGVSMEESESTTAKSQIYDYFFSSGGSQAAKAGGRNESPAVQRPFPNLYKILSYDTASFISVLNEAF